uniref:Uncharacterized protein n=1 Tax=Nelumbo nucifera TaxID=4432 RepID=A0A822YN04_NELNU|nr:TPA_asm: hypothetical protein HUJ06_011822 [Nelumbo nucifera]
MKRYDDVSVENAFYSKMQLSQGEPRSQSNSKSHGDSSSRGRRGGRSSGRSNEYSLVS